MKEATGELSMTAIVVVILGILAVALPLIINQVTKTMERNANCSVAFGCGDCSDGVKTCYYVPEDAEDASATQEIVCGCDPEDSED